MITELGKTSSVLCPAGLDLPPYQLPFEFSVHEMLAPFPWHHFQHVSLLVLVEIVCLVFAPLSKSFSSLPFISPRTAFAFHPSKVLLAVLAASSIQSNVLDIPGFHLSAVGATDVQLCPLRRGSVLHHSCLQLLPVLSLRRSIRATRRTKKKNRGGSLVFTMHQEKSQCRESSRNTMSTIKWKCRE